MERELINLAGAKVQYSTVEDEHRAAAVSITILFIILVMCTSHDSHPFLACRIHSPSAPSTEVCCYRPKRKSFRDGFIPWTLSLPDQSSRRVTNLLKFYNWSKFNWQGYIFSSLPPLSSLFSLPPPCTLLPPSFLPPLPSPLLPLFSSLSSALSFPSPPFPHLLSGLSAAQKVKSATNLAPQQTSIVALVYIETLLLSF